MLSTIVSPDRQPPLIVIASPHERNNATEAWVRQRLPNYEVIRLRDREALSRASLEPMAPSFVFFPHWSWRIPIDIHTRFSCVIFHMTDLPYGRGGSPLQNLIVRGHRETMLSALQCVEEVDAGPVYLKRPLSLVGSAEEILRRASDVIQEMIVEIVETCPIPVPQVGSVVAFERRMPGDGDLSPLTEVEQAYDNIRMLDGAGYPPAFLLTPGLRFEFSDARREKDFVDARVRIWKRP